MTDWCARDVWLSAYQLHNYVISWNDDHVCECVCVCVSVHTTSQSSGDKHRLTLSLSRSLSLSLSLILTKTPDLWQSKRAVQSFSRTELVSSYRPGLTLQSSSAQSRPSRASDQSNQWRWTRVTWDQLLLLLFSDHQICRWSDKRSVSTKSSM